MEARITAGGNYHHPFQIRDHNVNSSMSKLGRIGQILGIYPRAIRRSIAIEGNEITGFGFDCYPSRLFLIDNRIALSNFNFTQYRSYIESYIIIVII